MNEIYLTLQCTARYPKLPDPQFQLSSQFNFAPSEAEAQCAALCKSDKVYAVASEDMDSLTFGAPRFFRHSMDPSSRKIPVMEFDVSKVLQLRKSYCKEQKTPQPRRV